MMSKERLFSVNKSDWTIEVGKSTPLAGVRSPVERGRTVCHDPTDAKAVAKLAAIVRVELEEQTRRRIRRTRVPR